MSEVKDVRAALELLRDADTPIWPNRPVERALVSEGLAACDEMPTDRITGGCCYQIHAESRLAVFSAILRKAGLL